MVQVHTETVQIVVEEIQFEFEKLSGAPSK
jgi:hypothetical protein